MANLTCQSQAVQKNPHHVRYTNPIPNTTLVDLLTVPDLTAKELNSTIRVSGTEINAIFFMLTLDLIKRNVGFFFRTDDRIDLSTFQGK
jgi:hypothetical protein